MKIYRMVLGPVSTNTYIVADDNGNTAVIDPADRPNDIIAQLRAKNLTPRAILLTHGHFDHIGAIKGLKAAYPDLPVMIGKDDEYRLKESELKKEGWLTPAMMEQYTGLSATRTLSDGDTVDVGALHFDVITTPGHTEGGVTYRCGDYLFTGDTLFCNSIGRTDFAGGNYTALLASLRKLAQLPGDYTVLPGHDEETTLDTERRVNMYIKEALR